MMWKQWENKTIAGVRLKASRVTLGLRIWWTNSLHPTSFFSFYCIGPIVAATRFKNSWLSSAKHFMALNSIARLTSCDYAVGHCEGSGTHSGSAFINFFVGFLPANSRRGTMAGEMTRFNLGNEPAESCCLGNHELGRSRPQRLSKAGTP
jgi:hypothetical protein